MTKIQLSVVTLLLIGSAIALQLTPLNRDIFKVINHFLISQTLWMTLTNTGDGLFLGCTLFIVLQRQQRLLINALICALLIHYCIKFAKQFFAILRPEHTPELIQAFTLGPALSIDNYAMPSGHTASAFMAAIFIAQAYKLAGWKYWMLFVLATWLLQFKHNILKKS